MSLGDLIVGGIWYIVPKKYKTIGHALASLGMIILIVMMVVFFVFLWVLGHIFLLFGILGIYFSKTKNIRQKYVVYVFSVIIVVGLICHLLQFVEIGYYDIYIIIYPYLPVLIGYSFLLIGLLVLYKRRIH
ncbi:MAG: hypothetical protein ACTSQU_04545 [Promethearchaeota archaeon]